jgi:uncharacterized protein (DUF1015 family)
MPEIIPFRALRYNPRFVPDLKHVVAPPYDVISPEAQERYHARHPYNVVRLILGKDEAADPPGTNRYTRASETFVAWRRDGILRRDPCPAVYLYEQEFSIGDTHRLRRRGLLALVRLQDYAEKVIFPHERTFSRYKDDRLQLMRACPANLEAILGFYPGPTPAAAAILDRYLETDAAVRLVDEDGVGHRLWFVQDRSEVETLQTALRDRPVIIADGHHRYETALNFRNERRAHRSASRAAAHPRLDDFVLMNLVQSDDAGLVILPTHRVIRRRPECAGEALTATLARHFRIEPFPVDAANPLRSLRIALADLARRRGAEIVCAVFAGGPEILLLELADPTTKTLLAEGHDLAFAHLDVAVLHRLLIEGILRIPSTSQADDRIQYTRDESQALAAVMAGEASLALFLNAPRVEQVVAVAMAGERMPQKSTFFFPKVLSGLVINPLDAEEPSAP